MRNKRKKPKSDLRKYYTVFLELGLAAVLLIFIVALKIDFRASDVQQDLINEQETVEMEEIERTKQEETPPPPVKPKVPVEVPNDEIIEDEVLDISADLDQDQKLDIPPPPEDDEEEEDFFRVVENMPSMKGGQKKLYDCISYPDRARRAGIEGTVTIQFIVNENGEVENPTVLRGVEGLNDEALRCVALQAFNPGRQRGKAVRVQYSVPVKFQLQN